MVKGALKRFLERSPALTRGIIRLLLRAHGVLERQINEWARFHERGVHPKHRLMGYHRFFMDRVGPHDRVLDVGCGQGIVAADLAGMAREVVGIDIDPGNISWAQAHFNHPGLRFVLGDARTELPGESFDVAVLSNVLEHIEDRRAFLLALTARAPRFLLRVPMLERDWLVPFKCEMGLDHRLDATHFIEYTEAEFRRELEEAGLRVEEWTTRFGEYWVAARVK